MMKLTDMKIGRRLTLALGLSALLTLGMAGTAYWGNVVMNRSAEVQITRLHKALLAQSMLTDMVSIRGIILGLADDITATQRAELQSELERTRGSYQKKLGELSATEDKPEAKKTLEEVGSRIATWRVTNNQVIEMALQRHFDQAMALADGSGQMNQNAVQVAVGAYIDISTSLIEEAHTQHERTDSRMFWTLIIATILAVGTSLAFGFTIARSITAPLSVGIKILGRIRDGDVSQDVPPDLQSRQDEIGDLGRSVQALTESLRKLLREISHGVQTMASSATQLTAASSQTAQGVKSMSEKSSTVAAAAEESCATTTAVSSSMERASANLTSVAGATEEMSSTVAEIASNSEKARAISEKAMAQAQTISTIMAELGRAAQEIGKVTETITDISAQTNLLALNATIEAARAGTAGKGFAVVANEIKELAKQTSEATEDIKAKIAGVQNSTTGAVQNIEAITTVIKEIGNTVASTAAAIEEQATVTRNVAGEIAQATAVVREVNDQVAQTASVSRSIASDIASVNVSTSGIREGGEQVESSAVELSRVSEQLKVLVAQFSV